MHDSIKPLRCPACQNFMSKIFVKSAGANIDICTEGCGGMWFDNREINHFNAPSKDIGDILEVLNSKVFVKKGELGHIYCPSCGTKMIKTFSSVKKEIQIDECCSCGGKFLEHGELQAIRNEYISTDDRCHALSSFVASTAELQLKKLRNKL